MFQLSRTYPLYTDANTINRALVETLIRDHAVSIRANGDSDTVITLSSLLNLVLEGEYNGGYTMSYSFCSDVFMWNRGSASDPQYYVMYPSYTGTNPVEYKYTPLNELFRYLGGFWKSYSVEKCDGANTLIHIHVKGHIA